MNLKRIIRLSLLTLCDQLIEKKANTTLINSRLGKLSKGTEKKLKMNGPLKMAAKIFVEQYPPNENVSK